MSDARPLDTYPPSESPLRPHWDAILRIYDTFRDILDRNGLSHYVMFGSALGAVRHRGFIPWDDDMDVAMPRDEYDRFRDLVSDELPPELRWVDWRNTPEFENLFGKIQLCDRRAVEAIERALGNPLPQGVFLDVFPLDGYPASPLAAFRRAVRRRLLRARNYHLSGIRPPNVYHRVLKTLGRFSAPFFDHLDTWQDRCRVEERIARSAPTFAGRFCCSFSLTDAELPFFFPTRCLRPASKGLFEGREVPLPADPDTILRIQYGDYMTLPPPEKRVLSHEETASAPWKYGPTRPGP